MNRSWWLSVVGALALVVVIGALLLFPANQTEEARAKAGPLSRDPGAVRSGAQVQERLRQLSEARARGERLGPAGEVDAAGAAPKALRDRSASTRGLARPNAPAPPAAQSGPGNANDTFVNPQPEDIPSLKTMALHDKDPQRRLAAVTLLGASEDPEVIPVLAQALADQDEDVRMAAVQSLADFTGEAPIDAIEGALNDPSADVRYEALEVLSDIGGDRARRAVQRALTDPDEDVQELAQSILEFDFDEDQSQ
jgi:HEAT repeat protein